jgi:hypothetical protein
MTSDPHLGSDGNSPGTAPPAPHKSCPSDDEFSGIDLLHELRTSLAILTLLSGNLDLLYERLPDRERKRMIQDIRKHAQRLNNMVDGLLHLCNTKPPVCM